MGEPTHQKSKIVQHFLHLFGLNKLIFGLKELFFGLKRGPLLVDSSLERVQCTRFWKLTGVNTPAALMLTLPLPYV